MIIQNRTIVAVFAIAVLTATSPRSAVFAASGADKRFVAGEAIVSLQPGTTIEQINALYGTTVLDQTGNTYLLGVPANGNTNGTVRKLRTDPGVAAAGRNDFVSSPNARRPPQRHTTMTFPFDEASDITSDRGLYDTQPMLDILRIDQVVASRGEGVTVAVIDTGVDVTHPDLAGHLATDGTGALVGLDLVDGGVPSDDPAATGDNSAWGHGTFIAGLIAKVAPAARIMPIRALGPDGVGTTYNVAKAVAFARANGARIINMSFGAPDKLDGLEDELEGAKEQAILVAAVGNFSTDDAKQYPADESFVLAVAALRNDGVKAEFSNFGSLVDLAAPGVELSSTFPGNRFAKWSGTSFAAPLVAATAALVVSKQLSSGGFDADCATRTLVDTAVPVDALGGNRDFRGKIGALVDPVSALSASGCSSSAYDRIDLKAVDPTDRRSEGEAKREGLGATDQRFEVEVDRLTPNAQFTLKVTNAGGVSVTGSLRTDGDGRAEIEYSAMPDDAHQPLPSELNPVSGIRTVEVLRTNGQPVLRGDFGAPDGGGDDDGGGDGDGGDDGGGGGDDGGGDGGGDDGGGGDGGGDDGGGDDGGGSTSEQREITLVSSGVDGDADGSAKWSTEGSNQEFRVDADGLDIGAVYEIWVNGVLLASAAADDDGEVRVTFASSPDSDELPLPPSIDPVTLIMDVAIRLGGQTILSGTF